jgi:hypothetical protein
VDPILKRGVMTAEGAWETCGQDGEHIQEETRSTKLYCRCGLFAGRLSPRQPEQPRFWR